MAKTANVYAHVKSETKQQINTKLHKGMNDIENGRIFSADVVESDFRKMYKKIESTYHS